VLNTEELILLEESRRGFSKEVTFGLGLEHGQEFTGRRRSAKETSTEVVEPSFLMSRWSVP
jgi:hypothetical protein